MISLRNIAYTGLGICEEDAPTKQVSSRKDVFAWPKHLPGQLHLNDQLKYIDGTGAIRHPFMSSRCANMHENPFATDVTPERGPLQHTVARVKVNYFRYGADTAARIGMCPTFAYTQAGNIVTVGINMKKSEVLLLSPNKLTVMARHTIPSRAITAKKIAEFLVNAGKIFSDTSGGAYFFLDNEDRVVIPTTEGDIRIFRIDDQAGKASIRLEYKLHIQY